VKRFANRVVVPMFGKWRRQSPRLVPGATDYANLIPSNVARELINGIMEGSAAMRLGRTIATRSIKDTEVSEVVGLITGAVRGDAEAERALSAA